MVQKINRLYPHSNKQGRFTRRLGLFVFVLASAFVNSWAQTCELQWSSTQPCIDLTTLSGNTIQVPSNVTRLDESGLKLCPLVRSATNHPAVIFVMDHSSSMGVDNDYSGDPYGRRDEVTRRAIQQLATMVDTGWFAYIEFANDVESELDADDWNCDAGINAGATHLLSEDFRPLFDPDTLAKWTSPAGPIQRRCKSGTNYYAALNRVKEYAYSFDPGVDVDVSVVFFSDGSPSVAEGDTYRPLAENYTIPGVFPPIHGIFLNNEHKAGDALSTLAIRTNGSYHQVSPDDTAALNDVMKQLITSIASKARPTEVAIQIGSSVYQSVQVTSGTSSSLIDFGQQMPLKSGSNDVVIVANYQDENQVLQTLTVPFVISVSSAVQTEGTYSVHSLFDANCWPKNQLIVNGIENPLLGGTTPATVPWLDSKNLSTLSLDLSVEGFFENQTEVEIRSARTDDTIKVLMNAGASIGHFLGKANVTYVTSDAYGQAPAATANDAVFEVALFDTLSFVWTNPADARDTLFAQLLLYQQPSVAFEQDSLYVDAVATKVVDVGALGDRVSVGYAWLNGAPEAAAHLLRLSNTFAFAASPNLDETLSSRSSHYLVVFYTDPVFQVEYSDTTYLLFESPEMPEISLWDIDGDGRADQLQLWYETMPTEEQSLHSLRLVWGKQNQDTSYLKISDPVSQTPGLQISAEGAGERWVFTLNKPLPFGLTSGSGPLGEGSALLSMTFQEKDVALEWPIVDRVGPVLVDMWLDAKDVNLSYFQVSEMLGSQKTEDWIIAKRKQNPERIMSTDKMKYVASTDVYTLRLLDQTKNRINAGDSVRLTPEESGGLRDLYGNGAHTDNPFLQVRGLRESENKIQTSFRNPMIQFDRSDAVLPSVAGFDSLHELRPLLPVSDGQFLDGLTGQTISGSISAEMPTIDVMVQLPLLNGLTTDGEILGLLIDGELAWETELFLHVDFYDPLGQYVTSKEGSFEINDLDRLDEQGRFYMSFLWQADHERGLLDRHGRSIASGVLIARVAAKITSKARFDLDLYNEKGELSNASLKIGDVVHSSKVSISKIGYRHPQRFSRKP